MIQTQGVAAPAPLAPSRRSHISGAAHPRVGGVGGAVLCCGQGAGGARG